jgi:peptide/nickel transport system ATP-binding protein/oligopeptide transport system ATP-binding protein
MIAMALACNPEVLIADEPTTALDVTIQAQILDLLRQLRAELGLTVLLITHDLGVVAEHADRVIVMYAGRVVEESSTAPLFARPLHPYTNGLLDSIPDLDHAVEELPAIEGVVPSPFALPPGCRFAPRCRFVEERCGVAEPPLRAVGMRLTACRRDLDLTRAP